MVHALEKAARLLTDEGILIDIHPTTELARLEVRAGERFTPAGVITEADGGIEYRQADAAILEVVRRGLLREDASDVFTFITYAASLDELRHHLADAWTDAIIDDASARRIEKLLARAGQGGEVVMRERIGIRRLMKK